MDTATNAGPGTLPGVQRIQPRDVPLGGPRAMTVRRTLPTRGRTFVGAWCFVDHYGPDDVSVTGGMDLPPHPHTGLATVSWLFTGDVEHRDSAGNRQLVRPGELSLMTAGRAISHSEYTSGETTVLHGAQLWLALPEASRHVAPHYQHHRPEPVAGEGWQARVFLGSLLGSTSPVRTHTEVLGAEIRLDAGARVSLDVGPGLELGFLVDTGVVSVEGETLQPEELGCLAPGRSSVTLAAGNDPARLLVIGGEPFGEEIVMWWNFIGRSHEEVVEQRRSWEALLDRGDRSVFGLPPDDPKPPLHAPPMPQVRLRSRS